MKTKWLMVVIVVVLLSLSAGSSAALSAPSQDAGITVEDNGWVDCVKDAPLDEVL